MGNYTDGAYTELMRTMRICLIFWMKLSLSMQDYYERFDDKTKAYIEEANSKMSDILQIYEELLQIYPQFKNNLPECYNNN